MNATKVYGTKSKRSILALGLILAVMIQLNSIGASSFASTTTTAIASGSGYLGQSSWASGVMVQNGAGLDNGGKLSWPLARNVTVEARLPEINYTNGAILVILSFMLEDGSVLQLAAGIYPGENYWSGYAWLITNVNSYPQSYQWVLNSSQPKMLAGALVELSVFLTPAGWSFRLTDLTDGQSNQGLFSENNESSPLATGDQEVFALESYTVENSVFVDMGNLTLVSLVVDGEGISGGWYLYDGWDAVHTPLFVVGSTSPPSFISTESLGNGTLTWSYSEQWVGPSTPDFPLVFGVPIVVAVVAGCSIAAILVILRTKRIPKQ